MIRSCLLFLLPLVVSVTEQLNNDGIRYYGTSNVRYQKTYPPPLSFPGKSESIPISTTTDSPPSTAKTAPTTIDVPKISQVNVTTSLGPTYIPRRKPFLLPRRTRLESRPKQQATQTLAVVELQPKLFIDTQSTELVAPPPSVISVSQPSMISAPQVVIQVISGPQTPINTTFETSTVEMPVPNANDRTTLTAVPTQQVPTVTISPPNASPVAFQSKKQPDSFGSKPDGIVETESMSPLQEKLTLKLNSKPAQEQDHNLEAESILKSTPSSFKPQQESYPLEMRPYITFLPVLDSISVEEANTNVPPFLKMSEINQGSTTETPSKVEPVAGTVKTPLISTNLSSVNAVTLLPIFNTTSQTPSVTEIQSPLMTAPTVPLIEKQVITDSHVVIQLITDPQQPLNSLSTIYHPDVTSVQLNRTTDLRLPTTLFSTLNTRIISEATVPPKTEPTSNVIDPEIIVESEFVPQLKPESIIQPEHESTTQLEPESITQQEPEPITQSEPTTLPETTTQTLQSLPNLPRTEQISNAVKTKLKGQQFIAEYKTVPTLKHRGDAISEPSFTFDTPVNTTNQTLVTVKSQAIESASTQSLIATSQPTIKTTSPQPEAKTTLQESVVIANNQAVSAPQVVIQLMMPPQPSLSDAPQLPVSLAPKPLSITGSTSHILEAPQKSDQTELFTVSEVSDSKSELATPEESKQDARSNSELATHFDSDPEVEISSEPYSYPVKLRPKISFVAAPDSAWKDVVLKPQSAVLSPLLPRPNPIQEPDYGRHSQSTTQYSIIRVTQNTTEDPSNNVSTSKQIGYFNLDVICNDENGYHTVDNECDTYILCQQNQATKFSCPDGLYFNPAAKYNEYPCVSPSEVQCIGATGKLPEELGNDGIGYYGTSNVRYQKTYPPLLLFFGKSQSIPISTTTNSQPSTAKTAPPSVDVPKISQVNVRTSSGPIYIPRRKPFLLPRLTRLGSSSKQQDTQTSAILELQPKLFVDTQSTKLAAPQSSLISVSQPSVASTPEEVIQVISDPQTPINTTLETSTVEMPVLNLDGSTILTVVPTQQVPTVSVSSPIASSVVVQLKKEPVSFGSKSESVKETEAMSTLQEKLKLELNPKPGKEQDHHPEADSILKSTPSSFKSDQASYPIKMRPYITFVPVPDPTSVEKPDTTVPPFLKLSEINQSSTTETPSKVEPVSKIVEIPLLSTNLSSVNAVTLLPIINTTPHTPIVTEIQPPLVNASKLQFTEMQVITTPRIVIQLITDLKQPLNPVSAIYHQDVTSDLINRTTDLQLPTHLLSILNTLTISEINVQPKREPTPNVTDPEIIVESDLLPQLEPEITTKPEPESTTQPEPITQPEPTTQPEPQPTTQPELKTTAQITFQSLPNLPEPEQISNAVKIKLKGQQLTAEYKMDPPLKHRGDAISEPSFTFNTPVNATNQTLVTAKPQAIESASTQSLTATSQPTIKTTSPQPTTTTLQESVVIANNQPQAVKPQVIRQLTMPPQPSLSAAPQLPLPPSSKTLPTATTSRIPESPQKADQPGLFSVTEVSVATQQESKQDAQRNSESPSHFESETTFEPEVEISPKPYSYSVKLQPQVSFVAASNSAWKHVVLKPQPAILPPLLPRPSPIRVPTYGRPTPAPFISSPNTIWHPNYGRYTPSATQNPIIRVTQNTIEVPSNNVSTSKRLESLDLDFICNEGNGYYTVDNECDTYILCQQQKATKFYCPDGLYFNPAAKYDQYPCVYPSEVQCIGSTGKLTEQLSNNGIGYYGTSNVHYQKTHPPPLSLPGKSKSILISTTTTDSPPSTAKTAPRTVDVLKFSNFNVTTSSGPIYIPRQKPFLLPRPTRLESRTKQQAIQTSAVIELQPKLFVDTQSTKLAAPQSSIISTSQPSVASTPEEVIQVISSPQMPMNATLETSTLEMPIPNARGSTTLTVVRTRELPSVAVSRSTASPVATQPKKEPVSFESKPEGIPETEPMSPFQEKLELNLKPAQEQNRQPEAESILKSTPSSFKSDQVSYLIQMRPHITFMPVLDSVSVEEPDTIIPPFFNISDINQGSTTETSAKVKPESVTTETQSIATNVSSVNTVNLLSIINNNPQPPTVTEFQPPLVTVPKLPLTETETRVITAPRTVIKLITDRQLPLNPISAINQPDEISDLLNRTTDIRLRARFLSTLNKPRVSEATDQPKSDSTSNVTDPEIIVKSEFINQLEPEPTTQLEQKTPPELTTQLEPETTTTEPETTAQPTFQSNPNLPTPEQISCAVKIELKENELLEEYTTIPPLTHRGNAIAEPSFTFETAVNARNNTLVTTKSQAIQSASTQPATSQPPVLTISTQPEAISTIQESVVIADNQPKEVSAPQVIIHLMMPPQPSLNVAPRLPVSPTPKPVVTASKSRIPETPPIAYQPELFSVSDVTDSKSELATLQETKQDAPPNLESATHLKSETTFESEVEISPKPYSYPVKLRSQFSFVAAPDSAWKYVVPKPQSAVLPPLLPRPNPIREPAYGRPTPASFITTPNTIRQPNYSRNTTSTTQNPIIIVTQNTTDVPSNNKSTSKRPGSFNLDFVCDEGNGYYAVDNECDTYILCQQNQATKFSCPDGLYFDPSAKYNEYPCVYPSRVQCVGSTGKQYTRPTVTGTRQCPKQYGLFSMNDGDCSKYIMCNIGVATVMSCPAGLVFNPSTESCDWVANVPQCNPKVFKDFTCPDPPVDENGVIYKFKYRNQCTQYIACQGGYPRLLSCERGLAFDEESQSCISSVYVQNCES